MSKKIIICIFVLISGVLAIGAQTKPKYNYAAQKQFIPTELGQVYLGMPFRDFAKNFDFAKSEADNSYGWLEVATPLNRGNVIGLHFKVHGLTIEESSQILRAETITEKSEFGTEHEREIKRLDGTKLPAGGLVYEITLTYKPSFDLKSHLTKTFGKPGSVHKKGEDGYFYDWQWFKKTADGLTWMIRAFHEETKSLKLIGIIDGTEWDPEA
jgi:hypothetical protein